MLLEVTPVQALLWAVLTPAVFVGSIFFKRPAKVDRDDLTEIKRRFVVIGVASVLWPIIMFAAFGKQAEEGPSVLTWLGLQISITNYVACLSSFAVTLVLFIGPLYSLVFTEESDTEYDLKALRAYLVAPMYEELVFRSTLICPLIASGYTAGSAVAVSSAIFGLTHFYHWFEGQKREGDMVNSLFQVTFTTIFGLYAGHIFTVTGSYYACVLNHSFCNFMGFPDFGFMESTHPGYRYRVTIIIAYLMGIAGFLVLCPLMLDAKLFESLQSTLWAN
jgi:prenyl protein peptidase